MEFLSWLNEVTDKLELIRAKRKLKEQVSEEDEEFLHDMYNLYLLICKKGD